jgi:hypothetical protein
MLTPVFKSDFQSIDELSKSLSLELQANNEKHVAQKASAEATPGIFSVAPWGDANLGFHLNTETPNRNVAEGPEQIPCSRSLRVDELPQ